MSRRRALHESAQRGRFHATGAEWRRFAHDPLPLAFLPVTLLLAGGLAATLPADLRSAPPVVIDMVAEPLRESLLSTLLLMAAVMGALTVAVAHHRGVLAREQLFVRAARALLARATSTVIATAVFGAVGLGVTGAVFFLCAGRVLFAAEQTALAVSAIAAAGLWGFLIGVLVRQPILVLFVVPATALPASFVAESAPEFARWLLPRAQLALAGVGDSGFAVGTAVAVVIGWVVVLAVVVCVAERRRDRM